MNHIFAKLLTVLATAAFVSTTAAAQVDLNMGKRLIRNFPPSEYGYSRQNWSVTQAESGLLYFGNQEGIIEFDGINWSLIPAASGTTIRCLTMSGSRLYAGGKGDFGFLDASPGNQLSYSSLSANVELPDFGDLWSCAATDEAVFFQSSKIIFKYENENIETYNLADITGSDSPDYYCIYQFGGEIYLAVASGNGIYVFRNGTFERLDLSPSLPSTVVSILPHPDFDFLVLTSSDGLFQFSDGSFRPFQTDSDDFLTSNRMYDGAILHGDRLALSSTTGGVIVLSKDGTFLWEINEKMGLGSNAVYDVIEDRNHNIWMATEYGISMSEASSPYVVIDRSRGLRGTPSDAQIYNGQLLISSSDGLYTLSDKGENLLAINNERTKSTLLFDEQLIVATYGDLLTFKNGKTTQISSEKYFVRSIMRSEIDPSVILLGTITGLAAVRFIDEKWEELGYLAEFNGDPTSIAEDLDEGTILLGTEFRGLASLRPNFSTPASSEITFIDQEDGLPNLDRVKVLKVDGDIRLLTSEGVYKLNGFSAEKDESFSEIESSLSSLFIDMLERDNGIWGATPKDGLFKMNYDINAAKYFIDGSFLGDQRINDLVEDNEGALWILGDDEAIRFDEREDRTDFEFDTVIRRIDDLRADSSIFYASSHFGDTEKLELPFSSNSIRINFANLGFDTNLSSFYRVKLEGMDEQFSSWSSESWKDYTNLEPGEYVFKVQGRNRRTRNDSESEIIIDLAPPWYRSVWAYLTYFLVGLGLLYLLLSVIRRQILAGERSRSFKKLSEAHHALQKSHDSLRQTQGKLVQAEKLASMGQLTAGIAHEIKNPLNFINNFVQLNSELLVELRQEVDQHSDGKVADILPYLKETIDSIRDNSNIIDKHGQRADRVVQSMMEHSRGGKGELSKVHLNEFVEEYVHLAYFAIKSKKEGINIDLVQDYDSDCGSTVLMTQELGQVIINLLNNAYDAIHERQKKADESFQPRLTIATTRTAPNADSEGMLNIAIVDNGSGMSEEIQKRIFEPFYTTKASGEGTGLGLSLSHDIITIGHSGQITVDSELGKGTRFTISIPIIATVEDAQKRAVIQAKSND